MAEREYRRLTRSRLRHKGFVTAFGAPRSSLWLGKDHLLIIDSMRYTEEYKRFYFRDIQSITIRTTRRRALWNVVLSLLLLFWMAALVYGGARPDTEGVVLLLGSTFLILGVPLLVNNILGTACKVYLRTAVQTEELPPLHRVRRARNALDRIRPLIVAAQGQLTPEEVSTRMGEMTQSPGAFETETDSAQRTRVVTGPLNLTG